MFLTPYNTCEQNSHFTFPHHGFATDQIWPLSKKWPDIRYLIFGVRIFGVSDLVTRYLVCENMVCPDLVCQIWDPRFTVPQIWCADMPCGIFGVQIYRVSDLVTRYAVCKIWVSQKFGSQKNSQILKKISEITPYYTIVALLRVTMSHYIFSQNHGFPFLP